MFARRLLVCLFTGLLTLHAHGQSILPETLNEVTRQIDQSIESGRCAGAAHLVWLGGKEAYFHTAGVRDIESKQPLERDTLLRIYSMSKPVTSVAAMKLWEEGKFKLDDPLSKYIPELAEMKVVVGTGKDQSLVDADRRVTVADLFCHAAGISYGNGHPAVKQAHAKHGLKYNGPQGIYPPKMTIREAAKRFQHVPLLHQPGRRFTYGFNTDLLGHLIEIWSGKPLNQYMKEAVFTPLKMNDTAFSVAEIESETPSDRLAAIHTHAEDKLSVLDASATSPFQTGFQFHSGGGGLISTIDDYSKFCQMLVSEGKVGKEQFLQPETVALMFTDRLKLPGRVFRFGLGFSINDVAIGLPEQKQTAKSYAWGGYASTNFHLMPELGMFQIFVRQHIPTDAGLANQLFKQVQIGYRAGKAEPNTASLRWKKHVVAKLGHCNTATPIDVNGDGLMDVIGSSGGKVSLWMAPDFEAEVVLHRLPGGGGCIHSTAIDADGDGDLDWAGAVASRHPFWLENPGKEHFDSSWKRRPIDHEITGMHCLLTADIDNDGQDDLVINNFEPEKGIGDSIAWLSRPENPHGDQPWKRHVFADKTARGGSHYMGAADIDGDGWKEIAVGAKGGPFADGNWFAYWKHPGKSAAIEEKGWEKVSLATDQTGATNVVAADVNQDGKTDWIASRGHGIGIAWFENPSWTMHNIDIALQFPHSLCVADFDRDGNMDVASCGYGSQRVMWYHNTGQGNFEPSLVDANQESYDLKAVDMDGDGDMDLLNAGRGSRNIVWYENAN